MSLRPPLAPMPPPMPDRPRPPRAGYSPLLLSAAVWPGAGQLAQKRWFSAVCFLLLFTPSVAWLATAFCHVLRQYYAFGLDFMNAPGRPPGVGAIARPSLACTVIWLGGVIDTFLAQQRSARMRD